ncbi:HEXXH motif-containing putative peptide modification protein, partial [Streptosporangium algeriense]
VHEHGGIHLDRLIERVIELNGDSLRTPPRGQDSSSARDTFGTVALSEPRDGLGLAVTLAHEIQHAKLTALTEAVELTVPGYDRRFYAPWRDDPRPVYGLLQGAYAYLGVTEFWWRQRPFERGETAFRAEVEFARWRWGAHRVSDLLMNCDGLTEQGRRFVGRMRDVLEERLSEPVGDAAD